MLDIIFSILIFNPASNVFSGLVSYFVFIAFLVGAFFAISIGSTPTCFLTKPGSSLDPGILLVKPTLYFQPLNIKSGVSTNPWYVLSFSIDSLICQGDTLNLAATRAYFLPSLVCPCNIPY